MRTKFETFSNLESLSVKLQNKVPFTLITYNMTGIDDQRYSGHIPMHIVGNEYLFDETLMQYMPTSKKMDITVEASEELKYCLRSDFDIYESAFNNKGTNLEEYLNNENTTPIEEVPAIISDFIGDTENNTVIFNGNFESLTRDFDKINCLDLIVELESKRSLFMGDKIAEEYIEKSMGYKSADQKRLGVNYQERFNEGYLEECVTGTFSGLKYEPNRKATILAEAVFKYAYSNGYFETNSFDDFINTINDEKLKYMSEEGKRNYQLQDYRGKLNILKAQGIINESAVNDINSPCEFSKARRFCREYPAVSSDDIVNSDDYYALVIAVSTTGIIEDEKPEVKRQNPSAIIPINSYTGQIMSISLIAIPIKHEEGEILKDKENIKSLNLFVQADKKYIEIADNLKSEGVIDVYERAGVSREEYLNGTLNINGENVRVITKSEAANHIEEFTHELGKNVFVVGWGSAENMPENDKIRLFAQVALSNISGNLTLSTLPFIDLSKVCMEFCYYTAFPHKDINSDIIPTEYDNINPFLDPVNYKGDFSLDDIVSSSKDFSEVGVNSSLKRAYIILSMFIDFYDNERKAGAREILYHRNLLDNISPVSNGIDEAKDNDMDDINDIGDEYDSDSNLTEPDDDDLTYDSRIDDFRDGYDNIDTVHFFEANEDEERKRLEYEKIKRMEEIELSNQSENATPQKDDSGSEITVNDISDSNTVYYNPTKDIYKTYAEFEAEAEEMSEKGFNIALDVLMAGYVLVKEKTNDNVIEKNPVDEITEETMEETVENPVDEVVEDTASETVDEITEETVEETAENPIDEIVEDTVTTTVDETIEETVSTIVEAENEISKPAPQEQQNDSLKETVADLTVLVEKLGNVIAKNESVIAERDSIIEELKSQLDESRRQLDESSKYNNFLTDTIQNLVTGYESNINTIINDYNKGIADIMKQHDKEAERRDEEIRELCNNTIKMSSGFTTMISNSNDKVVELSKDYKTVTEDVSKTFSDTIEKFTDSITKCADNISLLALTIDEKGNNGKGR